MMKFRDPFTQQNPPASIATQASCGDRRLLSRPRLRLNHEGYCERLAALYTETIYTQAEIVDILNREFDGCSLKLPQLKKELKRLGLRRNKQYRDRRTVRRASASTQSTVSDHLEEEALVASSFSRADDQDMIRDDFFAMELNWNTSFSFDAPAELAAGDLYCSEPPQPPLPSFPDDYYLSLDHEDGDVQPEQMDTYPELHEDASVDMDDIDLCPAVELMVLFPGLRSNEDGTGCFYTPQPEQQ